MPTGDMPGTSPARVEQKRKADARRDRSLARQVTHSGELDEVPPQTPPTPLQRPAAGGEMFDPSTSSGADALEQNPQTPPASALPAGAGSGPVLPPRKQKGPQGGAAPGRGRIFTTPSSGQKPLDPLRPKGRPPLQINPNWRKGVKPGSTGVIGTKKSPAPTPPPLKKPKLGA